MCQWTTKAGHRVEKKRQLSCRVSQNQQAEGPSIASHPAPSPPNLPPYLHKQHLQQQQFTWCNRVLIHHCLSSLKELGPQQRVKAKAKNYSESAGQGSLCQQIPEFLLFSHYTVPSKAISPCAILPGGTADLLLLTSIQHSQEPRIRLFLPVSQHLAMLLHDSILSYHLVQYWICLGFLYTMNSTFLYLSGWKVLKLKRNWERTKRLVKQSGELVT